MKAEWERKKLADVLKIQNGYAFDSKKFNSSRGMPLVRIRSLKLGMEAETWFDGPYDEKYVVKAGDLLIGMDGEFGCFEWKGNLSLLNQRVCRLQDFSEVLTPKFLFYGVNDYLKAIEDVTGFTTVKHLSSKQVLDIDFPVPPLPEQHRIVAILDEAFDGIATAKANAEKNLQNARALFESHLQAVFTERGEGWMEAPLSELCDIKHGYAFEGEFFSCAGDYVLLTPGNFYEKGGYRNRGEKQKYYIGEIPRDYVLKESDLLVAMTEQAAGLLGSPILVPESGRFLHNQRLGLVTKKPGVSWTNDFFFHVFNTQAVRKEIHRTASGVKVRHTSPTKIGQVVVAFPTSIIEQKWIVAMLESLADETQRLESLYQRKLAALDELKKSLLHQAFSGQL
ncbi:MAG: restriction endonuclease subunit S [Zoogloea sp.]|nr:restriction endonuclease subunit S [Zoogloea sp.]